MTVVFYSTQSFLAQRNSCHLLYKVYMLSQIKPRTKLNLGDIQSAGKD